MGRPQLPITPERYLANCRPEGDCLVWQGARLTSKRNPVGYASVTGLRGRTHVGHRLMFELVHGPIPDGYEVDHLCSNPPCINPDHLEAVSPAENKRRVHERGHFRNQNTEKTTCPRGHEYDGVGRRGDGRTFRVCRACQRASAALRAAPRA